MFIRPWRVPNALGNWYYSFPPRLVQLCSICLHCRNCHWICPNQHQRHHFTMWPQAGLYSDGPSLCKHFPWPPDLQGLWVLNFHSIHDNIVWWFLSVFWCFLAISDNFSSIIARCAPMVFIDSSQTRCWQEKPITPLDLLDLSISIWYKEIINLLNSNENITLLSCHILFSLYLFVIHVRMRELSYTCHGQNQGKSLHSHTSWNSS